MNLEQLAKDVTLFTKLSKDAINEESYEVGFIALSKDNRHKRSFFGDEFYLQVATEKVNFKADTIYKDHETTFENAVAKITDIKLENGNIKVKARFYPDIATSLEAFNKFKVGLCNSVSVGFGEIKKMQKVGEFNGLDVIEIQEGDIVELSAVWQGADPNAKIAKFAKDKESNMEQNIDKEQASVSIDEPKNEQTSEQTAKDESQKQEPKNSESVSEQTKDAKLAEQVSQIIELGARFKKENEALKAISMGLSLKEFSRELLNQNNQNEVKEFNINKGVSMSQNTALADIILSAVNQGYKPQSQLKNGRRGDTFSLDNAFISQFSDNTIKSTGAENQALIATAYRGDLFIKALQADSQLLSNVTFLSGLTEKVQIPRDNSSISAEWVEEGGYTDPQKLSTDSISLAPNSLYACVKITRTMLTMSQLDLQAYAFNAIKKAIRLKLESEILYGTSKVKGLLSGQVSGINKTTGFMNEPTLRKVLAFEEALDALNHDTTNASFLLKGVDIATLKATARESATERKLIEDGDFQGYKYAKNNLLKQGDVIFGDFKNILVGAWGSLEVRALPYQGGITLLEGFYDVDVNYTRANAFVIDQNS